MKSVALESDGGSPVFERGEDTEVSVLDPALPEECSHALKTLGVPVFERAVSEDDVTTRDDDQQDAAAAARVFGDSDIASNARHRHRQNQYAEKLHRISHILHYCSIVILGIFAFQVLNSDDVNPLTPTVTIWVQL